MARRFRKKARHVKAKPSVVSMVPVAVLGVTAYKGYKARGLEGAGAYTIAAVTGYDVNDGKIHVDYALPFYGSIVGTYVAKRLIGMSGINRAMKGLPFRL